MRVKLSEDDAVKLFALRAADARGAPVVGAREAKIVRRIVRLLGGNKVAILLAAARADRESPSDTLAALEALDELAPPDDDVRRTLAQGEARRRAGDLTRAERLLDRAAADAKGDLFAEAEALRMLGAVYRTDGRLAEALAMRERALALHEALGDRAHVAIAWGDVGASLASLGRLREARSFHERAIAAHRELGRRREEGVEWSYLGVAFHRAGRFAEAKRAHERALEIHRETDNARGEGADRMHLGYVLHELGRLDEGRASYDASLRIFRRIGERSLEGVALSWLGALEIEARRPEDAGALLEQAMAVHREVRSRRHETITRLHFAQHHAALGETGAAREQAKRVCAVPDGSIELEHRAWALALAGRFADAAGLALEDEATSDGVRLLALAARVARGDVRADEGRAAALDARGVGPTPLGSRRRFAIAELERALHATMAPLVVAADGTRFVTPEGKSVPLGKRAPLVRVLRYLVERRVLAPGEPASADTLLAAGWPGERVLHEPGHIRVRNALAQLRKLGLKSAIVTRGGGYLLDPAIPLRTGA